MKLRSPILRKRVRIEIIPLIDIMFFLLASFMMVSLQLDQAANIKVTYGFFDTIWSGLSGLCAKVFYCSLLCIAG